MVAKSSASSSRELIFRPPSIRPNASGKVLALIVLKLMEKALVQTVSLGVAEFSAKMKEAGQLLEAADKVLYESKKSGRNRVSISKEL